MAYSQSWLEVEKTLGGRTALSGSPEEIRAQYAGLVEFLRPQYPKPSPAVDAQDGNVEGVSYRIYTPTESIKTGLLPIGIYAHGGGLVTGNIDAEDMVCRVIAELASTIIISVEYRLAPEYKIPTQLQDTLKVLHWAHSNAESFSGDANKLYTIGTSAGGGLALQALSQIVADAKTRNYVRGVAAIVPFTAHWDSIPSEYHSIYKSYDENGTDVPVITKDSMNAFYTTAGANPNDKNTFVINDTQNHKYYPPTYFVSCEKDPLRDDAVVMEMALKKAGVPTRRDHFPGLPHVFWIFPSVPEGQRFFGQLVDGVKWLISLM